MRWHDPDIVEARAKVKAAVMTSVPVPEAEAFAQKIDKLSRSERSARKQSAAEPSEVPTEPSPPVPDRCWKGEAVRQVKAVNDVHPRAAIRN